MLLIFVNHNLCAGHAFEKGCSVPNLTVCSLSKGSQAATQSTFMQERSACISAQVISVNVIFQYSSCCPTPGGAHAAHALPVCLCCRGHVQHSWTWLCFFLEFSWYADWEFFLVCISGVSQVCIAVFFLVCI